MGESDPAKVGVLGSDLLDFNPRGSYPANCAQGDWPVTTAGVTVDPCLWFVLTDKADDTAAPETLANNQHRLQRRPAALAGDAAVPDLAGLGLGRRPYSDGCDHGLDVGVPRTRVRLQPGLQLS